MFTKTLKYMYIYEILKNNFHPLEKLGTEPILSDVHPMCFGVNGIIRNDYENLQGYNNILLIVLIYFS